MTHIGIGFSQDPNPALAFKEAAITAKQQINLPEADLVLVFSTAEFPFNDHAFQTIQKILQPKHSICALTSGLLLPKGSLSRGVGLLALKSDDLQFGISHRLILEQAPPLETGIRLGREALAQIKTPHRQALISFWSGLQKNQLLLRGLQESLGRLLPMTGGISCGNPREGTSLIGIDGKTSPEAMISLLIGGPTPVITAAGHGWQPLGRPRLITRAEGNIIHEIDGEPAINLYRHYFPDDPTGLSPGHLRELGLLYPLGISTQTPRSYAIRHMIRVLPEGSIVCQGDVTQARMVYLMIGDKETCHKVTREAALSLREKLNGHSPAMLLVFSSMARQKLLGRSASHELLMIKDVFGFATPVFGMYTYGELAPTPGTQDHIMDNQIQSASIVITAIG